MKDNIHIEFFKEGRWFWMGGNLYTDLLHAVRDCLLYRMAGMTIRLYYNGRYI